MLVLMHPNQSKGNWKFRVWPMQPGSSVHPRVTFPYVGQGLLSGRLKQSAKAPYLSHFSGLFKQVKTRLKLLTSFDLPVCTEMSCICHGSACAVRTYPASAKNLSLRKSQVIQNEHCFPEVGIFSTTKLAFLQQFFCE